MDIRPRVWAPRVLYHVTRICKGWRIWKSARRFSEGHGNIPPSGYTPPTGYKERHQAMREYKEWSPTTIACGNEGHQITHTKVRTRVIA